MFRTCREVANDENDTHTQVSRKQLGTFLVLAQSKAVAALRANNKDIVEASLQVTVTSVQAQPVEVAS
eukprot:1615165-Amphidinium_carterae.1